MPNLTSIKMKGKIIGLCVQFTLLDNIRENKREQTECQQTCPNFNVLNFRISVLYVFLKFLNFTKYFKACSS